MDFTDPLQPRSIDDLVGGVDPTRSDDLYSPAPAYRPYQFELPWIKTPEPSGRLPEEPPPLPERLPSYNDCQMTTDLFITLMRDLDQ